MRKQAVNSPTWALLTEGVSSARIELHQLKHLVDRALSLVKQSEEKDHLHMVAGDIISEVPNRIDRMSKDLDRTLYALAKITESESVDQIPLVDRNRVQEVLHKGTCKAAYRVASRYKQSFGGDYWINAKTGKRVSVDTTHQAVLFDNPEKFGLSVKAVKHLKSNPNPGQITEWLGRLATIVEPELDRLGWVRVTLISVNAPDGPNATHNVQGALLKMNMDLYSRVFIEVGIFTKDHKSYSVTVEQALGVNSLVRLTKMAHDVASRFLQADLDPPLGYPGGTCHVVDRVQQNVRNSEPLVDILESGTDLPKTEESKVYQPLRERGIPSKMVPPFQQLVLSPHSQYRMDLRGVNVPVVRKALHNFLEVLSVEKSRQSSKYRLWIDALARQEPINWADPKTGLTVVFRTDPKGVVVITDYWTGEPNPQPTRGPCEEA